MRARLPSPSRRLRAAVALSTLAFLAGSALGSSSYIWCNSMAQAMSACCCHEADGDEETRSVGGPGAVTLDAACCETRPVAQATTSSSLTRQESAQLQPPLWIATTNTATSPRESGPRSTRWVSSSARAGPAPPKIPPYLRVLSLLL